MVILSNPGFYMYLHITFYIFANVGQQGHQGGGQNQQQGGFGKFLNYYLLYCFIMGKIRNITKTRLFSNI